MNSYIELNNSFKRTLVFRLGDEAGFFSEYNNMILAMAWCLKNEIKFELFSFDANFGYNSGWTDYFEPFCREVKQKFHYKYNKRPSRVQKKLPAHEKFLYKLKLQTEGFSHLPVSYKIKRRLGMANLLTQNVFNTARKQDLDGMITIKDLGFQGSLRELCKLLTYATLRFNDSTQKAIERILATLELPERYVGFHIRTGDKHIEYQRIQLDKYIHKAAQLTQNRNAFVATDDYSVIEELNTEYPEWKFYTLTQPDERGYDHDDFISQGSNLKREHHHRFFASILLLENAEHFIGTFSSNIGMFLGMRMPDEHCHGVDFDKWLVW